ncbi:MAG: YegP family protein [Crocinitomicaceae bacterium]|nr:YegP family protein [Crocinitomicaceae bacterium]
MNNPKFQIFTGKDGQYYFRLRAANGEIVCSSEGYTTLQSCKHGIQVIKDIAKDAPVEVE